jgi:hypothetical protein
MSRTEQDLVAVRELTDEIAQAGREPSLARAWVRVTAPPPRPSRSRRWLVPVTAGLAVLLLAVGGWWFLPGGGAGRGQQPASRGPGVDIPVDQAWVGLIAAARTATPAAPTREQLIYVRSEGEGAGLGGPTPQVMVQRRDAWYDPQGLLLLRLKDLESGETLLGGSLDATGSHSTVVDLIHPTPAWLAGLPSDPDELAALLIQQSENVRGGWSGRYGLWEALASLFSAGDLVVPTGTRVALYEALAREDGLTAQRTTIGGRDVIAITRYERDSGQQLLFDPATGRCVGRASLFTGDPQPDLAADGVMSWSVWTQSLVSRTG